MQGFVLVSVLVKRKFIIFVLVSISVHENITGCRANIIRIDRRNLLKLINKHLGKNFISIFIHKFISLHYYYLIVTFLYYQKCAKSHLQQCRNFKKFWGEPRTTRFKFKKLKNSRGGPRTTRCKVSGKEGVMSNAIHTSRNTPSPKNPNGCPASIYS